MACIPLPTPTLPTPPAFAFQPPPLAIDLTVNLCCKLAAFAAAVPPVSAGIRVPAAVLAALKTAQQAIDTYQDLLPISCPRE